MGIIEFKDVSFQYPNGFSAVENVSFEINEGEAIAIIGQNGAGKTTTVKMVNGLLKPTHGTVLIDGMDTKDYTTAQLSKIAGYVFQNPDDQIFHNNVEDEIRFGPKKQGLSEEEIVKKCQYYIDHDILIDCFIPITKKKKKYQGTWHIVDDILFKGYIFMITNQVEQLYTQLKKVPDLTKLLGNDGKEIYPIYPQEAMFLTKFSNKDHVVDISNGIIENDKIIINEGPLIGLEGLITKIDRHKRIAYVDVELLGKLTRVQVGLEIISKS